MSIAVKVENNRLVFGSASISFQRTLRIPEDGKTYPLPPSFGFFPIHKIDDLHFDKVPEDWKKHGGVFLPMYQREAMWIQFDGKPNEPKACKVAIGKVNSISGKPWNQKFVKGEQQDYVVIPNQPWLDGINAGDGYIKQFVAMPLGGGYTVEAQVTGKEDVGGLQVIVYNPKPNRFPQQQPPPKPQVPLWQPPQQPPQPLPQVPLWQPPQPQPLYPVQPMWNPPPPPVHQQQPLKPTPPLPMYSPFSAPMMQASVPNVMPSAVPQMLNAYPAAMKESARSSSVDAFADLSIGVNDSKKNASYAQYNPMANIPQSFAAPSAPSAVNGGYNMSSNFSFNNNNNNNNNPFFAQSVVAPPVMPVRQVIAAEPEAKEMGLAAGGKMKQSIYEDTFGIDSWDENNYSRVFIHIVNSTMYKKITGKEPPATPIDASAYTNFGYPWFNLYDEHVPSVDASNILSQVKSVSEIDKQKFGYDKGNNASVPIPANQVHSVVVQPKDAVRDGDW